jgi:hypothetical protein
MFSFLKSFLFSGIFAAALVAFVAVHGGVSAQEADGSGISVGTYNPQQIAQQSGIQQKMMQGMQGLQQRAQQAQQTGNQQEMQQIQMEAQKIQQQIIGEFQTGMNNAIATVAEKEGLDLVVIQVAYAAPGIQSRDITQAILEEMGLGQQAMATPPQQGMTGQPAQGQ